MIRPSNEYNIQALEKMILILRDKKVMLDLDLARIYGVTIKKLNQAVRNNLNQFTKEFAFPLTYREIRKIGFNSIGKTGRLFSYEHYAFTEHGAIMVANIMGNPKAKEMRGFIQQAFNQKMNQIQSERSLGEKINTWAQVFAIICGGFWALGHFFIDEVMLPDYETSVTTKVTIKKTKQITNDQIPLELDVTASNPGTRDAHIFHTCFYAYGIKTIYSSKKEWPASGLQEFNFVNKNINRVSEIVALGPIFNPGPLKPGQEINFSQVFNVPAKKYNLVNVATYIYTTSHKFPRYWINLDDYQLKYQPSQKNVLFNIPELYYKGEQIKDIKGIISNLPFVETPNFIKMDFPLSE